MAQAIKNIYNNNQVMTDKFCQPVVLILVMNASTCSIALRVTFNYISSQEFTFAHSQFLRSSTSVQVALVEVYKLVTQKIPLRMNMAYCI